MSTPQFAGPSEDPDRYQLVELRSRGGEGELWAGWLNWAQDQSAHRLVAVKVFHPGDPATLGASFERLRQQVELLSRLDHPNVVKVIDAFVGAPMHPQAIVGPSGQVMYSVMEWVHGENLAAYVTRVPQRDPLEMSRIVSRLAAGIDELHSGRATGGQPVLHRDIKPANVIVNGDDVRLVDLGLVRLAASERSTVAGSLAYLAPEVIAGAPQSEASDRFGLGATAYFLYTGVDPNHTRRDEMHQQLLSVPGIVDHEGFAAHLLSMQDPDPSRRPTNMVEWAQALAVGTVSQRFSPVVAAPAPGADTPVEDPQSARKGRGKVVAAVAAIVLLLVGGAAAWALGSGGSDEVAADGPTTTSEPTTTSTTTSASTTTTSMTSTTSTTSTTTTTVPEGQVRPGEIQYLADITPVDRQTYSFDTGQGSLSGQIYTRSIMVDPNREQIGFVEYDLARGFSTLSGTVGVRDDVPSPTSMKLEVFGDGAPLFDQTVGLGQAVPMSVDVSGVLRLRVQVTDVTGDHPSDVYAIFGDLRIEP